MATIATAAAADILKDVQGTKFLWVATLLAIAYAAGERADGQAAGAEAPAKAVEFSLVALDSQGQPVGDLTAGDFEIADAGKKQKVAIFRHGEGKLQQAGPLGPGEFSNRAAANVPHATLILLDLLNNTFGARGEISSYLVDALNTVESGDNLFLYVLTAEGKLFPVRPLAGAESEAPAAAGVSWTRDARALVDGALTKTFQLRPTAIDTGTRIRLTYGTLRSVGSMLAGIPGRKNIVWVTRGVPLSLPPAATRTGEPLDFTPVLRRLCLILNRFNVAVYPVMQVPPGMGGTDESASAGVNSEEALRQIGSLTGGPASATNTISATLRQAMLDVRTSYQLGYYPPAKNWDGKFHDLRVTCTRKGVRVQAMTGYFALADQPSDEREALNAAALTAFDASEIGLRCTMTPDPKDRNLAHFKLRIDPADLRVSQQGDRYSAHVDAQMAAFPAGGEPMLSAVSPLDPNWSAEELAKAKIDGLVWNQDFNPADAGEKLRFLVYDRDTHAVGTLTIPLKKAK
jgi:VWFA-related protein